MARIERRLCCAIAFGGFTAFVGDGTYGFVSVSRTSPHVVAGELQFTSFATGGSFYDETHACGLASGTVYCWGNNQLGELGTRTGTIVCVPPLGTGGQPQPCSPVPLPISRSTAWRPIAHDSLCRHPSCHGRILWPHRLRRICHRYDWDLDDGQGMEQAGLRSL